jgi:hypothetical protein
MRKKKKTSKDDLRKEYTRSDFPGTLVRGKYARRLRESSNMVVLKPEVAAAFPNEEAVNKALLSLIEVARATTGLVRTCHPYSNELASQAVSCNTAPAQLKIVGFNYFFLKFTLKRYLPDIDVVV